MSIASISLEQLKQAVQIREQIAVLETQRAAILGGTISTPDAPILVPRRRGRPPGKAMAQVEIYAEVVAPVQKRRGGANMSAEGRARIAAAQKARWAKVHAAKVGKAKVTGEVSGARKRRKMSPEGRANVAAAAKARWAKNRKQKGK